MAKHEEHLCRFNDGEQSCDCYNKGYEDGKKEANDAWENRIITT